MEITLPNSQGNQSFRSVAGKRSSGRAVYVGDPRLALLGRSPVGAEKSALTTPCPIAASSVFSGKVQLRIQPQIFGPLEGLIALGMQPAVFRLAHLIDRLCHVFHNIKVIEYDLGLAIRDMSHCRGDERLSHVHGHRLDTGQLPRL